MYFALMSLVRSTCSSTASNCFELRSIYIVYATDSIQGIIVYHVHVYTVYATDSIQGIVVYLHVHVPCHWAYTHFCDSMIVTQQQQLSLYWPQLQVTPQSISTHRPPCTLQDCLV